MYCINDNNGDDDDDDDVRTTTTTMMKWRRQRRRKDKYVAKDDDMENVDDDDADTKLKDTFDDFVNKAVSIAPKDTTTIELKIRSKKEAFQAKLRKSKQKNPWRCRPRIFTRIDMH